MRDLIISPLLPPPEVLLEVVDPGATEEGPFVYLDLSAYWIELGSLRDLGTSEPASLVFPPEVLTSSVSPFFLFA